MEQSKVNYTRCVVRVILLRIQLSAAWMIAASTIIIIITIIQAPSGPTIRGLPPLMLQRIPELVEQGC